MRHLLDVNVLLALLDPDHMGHEAAWRWFSGARSAGWATCPIVQAGFLRIITTPTYRPAPAPLDVAAVALKDLCKTPDHEFWSADGDMTDHSFIDATRLGKGGHVTDAYLLALAASRGGRLATFDRKMRTDAVPGGKAALLVIPA